MGVDQTFYFGPYFECKWEGRPAQRKVYSCSNETQHRVTSNDKFCSSCGGKVETRLVATRGFISEVDDEALREEINERLYEVWSMGGSFGDEKTDYWVSNMRDDGIGRNTSLEKYEEACLEITPTQMQEEKDTYAKTFANEYEALKKYYKQVRLCWGILSYCT